MNPLFLSLHHYTKEVVRKDGMWGLFARGLGMRLLTNMMQSMVFSVIWKAVEEHLNRNDPS